MNFRYHLQLTITLLWFLCVSQQVLSQCGNIVSTLPGEEFDHPMRYLRLNFHFMRNDNGQGNFNPTNDGLGNPYSGADYANEMIQEANNNYLSQTAAMNFPPGNNLPVHPKKWRFILNGVYYHNSSYYQQNSLYMPQAGEIEWEKVAELDSIFGADHGEAINVYIVKNGGGGFATYPNSIGGNRVIVMAEARLQYENWENDPINNSKMFYATNLLIHEHAHVFGLIHTMAWCGNDDPLGLNCNDGCDDTPTGQEMLDLGYTNYNAWDPSNGDASNNMADYNTELLAVTPCQLNKIYQCALNQPENDYGMINYFTNSACTYADSTVEINGTVTYDEPYRLYGDIQVNPGAHLIVTCRLEMNQDRKITVKAGGMLTVDGGTITTTCDGEWQGILVEGQSGQSQYPVALNGPQGVARFKSNAVIEYAAAGVTSSDGGVIEASSTTFLNNSTDVLIYPFQNTFPSAAGSLAGSPWGNLSYFKNCNFMTTGTLKNSSGYPDNHVELYYVDGIDFSKCNFENTIGTNVGNMLNRGNGIYSEGASYHVRGSCNIIPPFGSPCSSWTNTTFTGLAYGIKATSYSPSASIEVAKCTFTNNWRGIYMLGMDHSDIYKNNFEVSNPPGDAQPYAPDHLNYGVYSDQTRGFAIEENTFTTTGTAHHGIVTYYTNNNLESSEDIYKNTFNGMNSAIVAYGHNDGLLVRCNTFLNSDDTDIALALTNGTMASPQGSCTDASSPAGNYFDGSACSGGYQIYNGSTTSLIYKSHSSPAGYMPTCTYNMSNQLCSGLSYSAGTSCPSRLDPFYAVDQANNVHSSRSGQIHTSGELDDNIKLIDGNRTNILLALIQNSSNSNLIRNQLLNDSPYLSDLVMMTAINSITTALTEADLTTVLLANAPFTGQVLDAILHRNPPFNASNRNQLLNAQNGPPSPRSLLEEEMLTQRREIELATNEIVRIYRHLDEQITYENGSPPPDTIIWGDTLVDYLEYLDQNFVPQWHSDVKVRLAAAQIANNDLAGARQTLMDFQAGTNKNNQAGMMLLMLDQLQSGLTLHDLTPAQKSTVQGWALDQATHGHVGAESLLALLDNTPYFEKFPAINLPPSPREKAPEISLPDEKKEENFRLFPNPGQGNFVLEYKERGQPLTLRIRDVTGKLLMERFLPAGKNKMDIEAGMLGNGLFLYQIIENGQMIHSGKVIIQK